jgi:hypothetical protein
MKFIFFVLLSMSVEAGLLDFVHIKQANSAYQKQDYQVATEEFANIDNDAARLNQANVFAFVLFTLFRLPVFFALGFLLF